MPITKSAKKTFRSSTKKRVFNLRRSSKMKALVKEIKNTITEGKTKEAQAMLPSVYRAIDKAQKRGILKKNTVARKKSRITAAIKRAK